MVTTLRFLLGFTVLHVSLFMCTAHAELGGREARSDDTNALEPTVSLLSQKVDMLSAQLTAQANDFNNQIQLLKNQDAYCKSQTELLNSRIDAAEEVVAFTAYFTEIHQQGFGAGQMLKFDTVGFNAGSGYNTASGLFTAPANGTYVFFVHVTHTGSGEDTQEVDVYQDSSRFMTRAIACCHNLSTGSSLVTTYLARGQTMHVQMAKSSMFLGGVHTSFSGFKISPL